MADGVKGIATDINEAVVKPVADEVGKAIEQGTQSVVYGSQATSVNPPKSPEQIKQEEQKKLAEARRKIAWYKNLSEAQAKIRQEQKEKEAEKLKVEKEKKEIKQFEVVKKQQSQAAIVKEAQTKTEVKKGVGG